MDHHDTQNYGYSFKGLSTVRLEVLLSNILKEMRRRDSKHMASDVVTNSQSFRIFKSTGKLPKK